MTDGGNRAESRNRLAGWSALVCALVGAYALLVLAVVVFRGLVPAVVLAKSEVTKTFAWGGIYGGATGIKEVEEGFAEAVAKVVLGQSSQ